MAPKKETIDCVVVRDFWVTADDRKRAANRAASSKQQAGSLKRGF